MKGRAISLLLIAMLAGFCLASAPAFPQSTGLQNISGTVVDANGKAVPNLKVTLTSVRKKAGRSTKTDKTGYFHFEFVPVGEYTVRVDDPGYESGGMDLEVTTYAEPNIRLKVSARKAQEQASSDAKQ